MNQQLQNQMNHQNGLPTGWELKRLDDIGEVYSGSTPSTSVPELWDGSVTWITPNDLSKLSTPYISDSARTISRKGLKSSSTHLLPARSIVISSRAPIGYVAISLIGFCTNQGCKSIELRDEYSPEFVYYNLNFHVDKLKNLGNGTTFTEITKTALCTIELPFPKRKEEQTHIAAVLSCIDRTIEQTESLIAKQQRIKTGLMQDLLTKGIDKHGNIRSEVTHEFKDSPLGRIPKEWDVLPLTKIAEYQNGGAFPSSEYRDAGIPLLRPGNLLNEDFVSWDKQHTIYLPEVWGETARDFLVEEGELVMNLTAQSLEDMFLGRVCMTQVGTKCLLNQRIARFRAKGCDLRFLFWAFKGPFFRQQIDQITQGSKVQHIYNSNLDKFVLAIPKSNNEQKLIADILFSHGQCGRTQKKYLDSLFVIKKGLMQDLLTGKVGVENLLAEHAAVSA